MKRLCLCFIVVVLSHYAKAQSQIFFNVQLLSSSYSITCSNPAVKLIASSNYSDVVNYSWVGPNLSLSGNVVAISTPGIYTVTASSNGLQSAPQLITIGVNTTVPISSINPTYTSMSCHTLTAPQVTASCNLNSNLRHNIMSPAGGTLVVSTPIATYNPAGAGTYTHVLIDQTNGCESSSTFTVASSSGIPTFDLTSSQNFTLGCASKSVAIITISGASTFPPGGTVSYTLIGPPTSSNVTTGILGTITSYSINTPGVWTAIVRDDISLCDSRVPISVIKDTVQPNFALIVPTTTLNCINKHVLMQAASSESNLNYSWHSSSGFYAPGDTLTASINTLFPNNTLLSNYTVNCINSNNQCESSTFTSIYQNVFKPNAQIFSGTNQAVLTCHSPSVILTNQSSTGIPSGSGMSYNLPVVADLWKVPQPLPALSNTASCTASVSGLYTLYVTDMNNGCKSNTSLAVFDGKVYPVVNNPSGPTPFCINYSVVTVPIYPIITGNVNAYTYQWSGPPTAFLSSVNSPTAYTNALGIYSVVVTNTVSGCATLAQVIVANCVTGISESTLSENTIAVYPNPSSSVFNLSAEHASGETIRLYNALGSLLLEQNLQTGNNVINLSEEKAGIYFITVVNSDKILFNSKLIKQ